MTEVLFATAEIWRSVRSVIAKVFTYLVVGLGRASRSNYCERLLRELWLIKVNRRDIRNQLREMLRQLGAIQGLLEKVRALGLGANEPDAVRVSAAEFILEGLYAHRRISRSEERGFSGEEKKRDTVKEEESKRPGYRRPQFN